MNPLSHEELALLEASLLPALERHHLRLMAHSLRTLQQIAASQGLPAGHPLPEPPAIRAWLRQQPELATELAFVDALCEQLQTSGVLLQQRAAQIGRHSALDLSLEDLIAWAKTTADERLLSEQPAPPQTTPKEPPTGP